MAQSCYLRLFLGIDTVSCNGKDEKVEKFALIFFTLWCYTCKNHQMRLWLKSSPMKSQVLTESSAQLSESSGQFKAPLTVLFSLVQGQKLHLE